MTTPLEFAKALLAAGGWPQSDNNITAVVAWSAMEGGHYVNHNCRYNPMNTMMPMPGSTYGLSNGVKAYQSWDDGLAATLKTLHNGLYNNVIQNLASSADPVDTISSLTTWTGGTPYPTSQIDALYNSYANHADWSGTNLSSTGGSTVKKVFMGAILIGCFAYLWNKTK
jgi:hypothetical protein